MILFDWKKVLEASKGNQRLIMRIIDMLTHNTYPKNKKDALYDLKLQNYYGHSFLRYPEKLLENQYKYELSHCCHYVALASLRNLGLYQLTQDVSLPVEVIPERLCSFIPQNPLINACSESRSIKFKYEEK